MKIIKSSKETFTTKELYMLVKSPEIQKMSSAIDSVIDVSEWLLREEEESNVLSILTPEGEVFATNSKTFIREFTDIVDIFNADGNKVSRVKVAAGRSHAGRQFITAVAVFD